MPLYRQVYARLRQAILGGQRVPGERLPASRELARTLGVSRNVVLLAYDQLRAEGYVEGRVGAGTFVATALPDRPARPSAPDAGDMRTVATPRLSAYARRVMARYRSRPIVDGAPPRYDFRFGAVATDRHSVRIWRQLLNRHAERFLTIDTPVQGHAPLREAIADYLQRNRGMSCSTEQIMVVNGTQQALDLIARVFVDPGDRVVIEEPHYAGAREVMLAAGARLLPVPVDGDGLPTEQLPGTGARLVYITPSHQFPTGAVLPLARRLALLDWARRHGAYVIEDDYDSEFRYAGRPLESLQVLDRDGRTLHIGTFSKNLFPSLRLGFLILPAPLIEPFRATKQLADRHSAMLNQVVLAEFIAAGHFERHLRRMRNANERRRIALLRAIERELGARVEATGNHAGVHLALWLPGVDPARLDDIVRAARAREVGVYSLNPSFHGPVRRTGLLLGYERLAITAIEEGIRRLAGVLREYL